METRTIKATTSYTLDRAKAACFMDVPFAALKYICAHKNADRYEPYGIALRKKDVYSQNGPGHLEPWKSIGAAGGNDFEINFMPDYQHLHEAGYNVLCYDLRNFGHSGAANGGIAGNGLFEYRDVIGSLQYVKGRKDLAHMTAGLFSRCMGMNATMIAMKKHPEFFKDIRCIVAPQPISLNAFYGRISKNLGIADKLDDIDAEVRLLTGLSLEQMSVTEYAKAVTVPTFIVQVRNDVLTFPSDVQTIFDNIPVKDKKLFWIEGTSRRFDGYNYFPENPKQMVEWFDTHMG